MKRLQHAIKRLFSGRLKRAAGRIPNAQRLALSGALRRAK